MYVKQKLKLSYRHAGTKGERICSCNSFWEKTPGTHWTGGWMGLRTGLDTEARGTILASAGD
jgi:hypothetical protein